MNILITQVKIKNINFQDFASIAIKEDIKPKNAGQESQQRTSLKE